jgi:O-antigen/teichoic acid export membrane protein
MSERKILLGNTLFASVGIYVEYFLGMLTSILLARYLGPSDFGIYGLIMWLAGLGVALINAGITTGMIKFVAELRGNSREDLLPALVRHLRSTQRRMMMAVLVVSATVYLIRGKNLVPDINVIGFGLLLLSVSMRAPYMLNIAIAKGFENFRSTAAIAAIVAPINLALVGIAILLRASLEGFVLVYALVSIGFCVVSAWRVRGLVPNADAGPELPQDLRARILNYSIYATAKMFVAFFCASGSEVLFLNLWGTSADAGQFRAAYQLASSASLLVPGVFAATLLPFMARSLGENPDAARRRFVLSIVHLAILAAPVAAFGISAAPDVIVALYGAAYHPAAMALTWTLASCCVTIVVAGTASSLLVSTDQQRNLLIVTIVNGAIKVPVGIYMIIHYGLLGGVVSFALDATLNAITQFWLALRINKAKMPWSQLARVVAVAVIAAIPAKLISHYLPPWPALFLGAVVFGPLYVIGTFVAGCWDHRSIDYMHDLVHRLGRTRLRTVEAFLAWARLRAHTPVDA